MRMSAFCFRRKNQPKCCIPSEQKKKLVDLLNKTIKKITPSFNHKNGPKIVAESWVGSGEHSGMRTALEDWGRQGDTEENKRYTRTNNQMQRPTGRFQKCNKDSGIEAAETNWSGELPLFCRCEGFWKAKWDANAGQHHMGAKRQVHWRYLERIRRIPGNQKRYSAFSNETWMVECWPRGSGEQNGMRIYNRSVCEHNGDRLEIDLTHWTTRKIKTSRNWKWIEGCEKGNKTHKNTRITQWKHKGIQGDSKEYKEIHKSTK